MKSQSLKTAILASLLAVSWYSIAAQGQSTVTEKAGTSEAKTLVRAATEKRQVQTLIATAKTPGDHKRIAEYLNQEASRMEDEAKDHDYLSGVYRKSPYVSGGGKQSRAGSLFRTAEHCESIAKSLREAAQSLRELADEHEQMAKDITQ
jgi:hypothetical protein